MSFIRIFGTLSFAIMIMLLPQADHCVEEGSGLRRLYTDLSFVPESVTGLQTKQTI